MIKNLPSSPETSSTLELFLQLDTVKDKGLNQITTTALDILLELSQSPSGALEVRIDSDTQPILLSQNTSDESPAFFTPPATFESLLLNAGNTRDAQWVEGECTLRYKYISTSNTAFHKTLTAFLQKLAGTLSYYNLHERLQQSTNEMHRLRLNLEYSFNSIPDAIVTVAEDMRILSANEAFLALYGGISQDYKEKTLRECFGDTASPYEQVINQTLELGRITSHFRITSHINGKECKLELNAAPLRTGEFCFGGAVLVVKDMTRLAVLEQQLKDRKLLNNMVGKSECMKYVASMVSSLSDIDTTVLITGESGTGKELVADALHYTGNRAEKKIIKVNCAALSESLLESELFGHARGAFTGATSDSQGRVAAAEGGTLFLDEIGDLPLSIQLKLLRFLEYKQYERVGSSTPRQADVRVVTATNADLAEKVREGTFRTDLYYRLNVFQIELPPLRERKEDIPLLIQAFVKDFNNELGRSITSITPDAMDIFMGHNWPGNIRELRNCIEYASILCKEDLLQAFHLPKQFRAPVVEGECCALNAETPPSAIPASISPIPSAPNSSDKQDVFDAQKVIEALKQANGKKAKAARALGISRPTFYRWMKRAGIDV